jgi:HAD superfamily hydrolase (TIGR01509 family)
MISTVIFDLDGLLADTEKLHRRAYQEVLGKFGIELTDSEYGEHWIRFGKGIDDFVREKNLSVNPSVLRAEKTRRYQQLVEQSLEPMPGALSLLERLEGRKTCALASSSYPDAVECVLRKLGVARYFATIAAKDSVGRLKPFPDIFLYVAERLNVEPASCVVLEDAEKGVIAAKDAGMKCIAVPNEYTHHNDFSKATLVLSSLTQVTLELLDSGL